jgi:protein phosphatase
LLANHRIVEGSKRRADAEGMATTLAAVLALSDRLWVTHVGDSRVYRYRGGQLKRLTCDHTVGTDLEARARVKPEVLARMPPSTLTRALGLGESVEPDVQMENVSAGDVVLLATDGLTKVVDEGAITEVLDEYHDLGAAVAELIARANERGGPDNITCILARWSRWTVPAWAP